jgi:antitoxin component YwqK of YwqJK toxin-antitoxin module
MNKAMKSILPVFLSFLTLLSLAQNPELNQLTSDGSKTGNWKKKHSSGKIKFEGTFENDTPVGEFNRYDINGKLTSKLIYSKSGQRAAAEMFKPNGVKIATGIYINQKKDSVWQFFDKKGFLFSEQNYAAGILEGESKEYYPNGNIHFQRNYKSGEIEGVYKEFYPNGQLRSKKIYQNGNPTGLVIVYYNNGVPKIVGKYNNGLKDGAWKFYDTRHKILKTETHENGSMIYTSEQLISYWNDSIKNIRTVERFAKSGRSYLKSFYPSGELQREGPFWKGKKDSLWNYYTIAGQLETIRTFDKGKRQGNWTYKYPSGKVKSEEAWYLDRREGEYVEYYENGKIKIKGNYKKGNKSGDWQYFDENGVLIETNKNDEE